MTDARTRIHRWATIAVFMLGGISTSMMWEHSFLARWVGGDRYEYDDTFACQGHFL